MKKSRFSDSQKLGILQKSEGGIPIAVLYQEHGIYHRHDSEAHLLF